MCEAVRVLHCYQDFLKTLAKIVEVAHKTGLCTLTHIDSLVILIIVSVAPACLTEGDGDKRGKKGGIQ